MQLEANDSSSRLSSADMCSSDEGNYVSGLPETVRSHAAAKPERSRLPQDIEDGLDDTDDADILLDISDIGKEDLLELHSKTAAQRNSYRRKCVQVSKLKVNERKNFSDMKSRSCYC